MVLQVGARGNSLVSFSHPTPRMYITAEDEEFDQETLKAWRDEGFEVAYVPMGQGGKSYVNTLQHLGDKCSVGQGFGIVAYGDAAAVCLETLLKPATKLCCLIAYYPTSIPSPNQTHVPSSMRCLIHLAGGAGTVGVTRNPEILGIQGKRKTTQKRIDPGIGTGGLLKLNLPSYTYPDVAPGFAEQDLDEYNRVADGLAWSRSLQVVRLAFGTEVPIERTWEENEEHKLHTGKVDALMGTFSDDHEVHVTYAPSLTGGVGKQELLRFYRDFFTPSRPPSLQTRLLSRTIGSDQIVDELYVSFKHSCEMHWILPGIPPTNKAVEVVIVSIVAVKAGKLVSEHVYWDQGSVLVQVGLIDPEHVPKSMAEKGVDFLPLYGVDGAKKILDVKSIPTNEMVTDW